MLCGFGNETKIDVYADTLSFFVYLLVLTELPSVRTPPCQEASQVTGAGSRAGVRMVQQLGSRLGREASRTGTPGTYSMCCMYSTLFLEYSRCCARGIDSAALVLTSSVCALLYSVGTVLYLLDIPMQSKCPTRYSDAPTQPLNHSTTKQLN